MNKLRTYLLLAIVATFGLISCSNSDPFEEPDDVIIDTTVVELDCEGDTIINDLPATFEKKVLIEEFTGTWCGWCPLGTYLIDTMAHKYEGRVFAVAIHAQLNDPMEVSYGQGLVDFYSVASFPSSYANRTENMPISGVSPTATLIADWDNTISTLLTGDADLGLAISTEYNGDNTEATVDVKIASNTTLSDNYRLHVYVLEDGVNKGSSYNQVNYLSGNANHESTEFYDMPDPIVGYPHSHVLRGAATTSDGEAFTGSEISNGTILTKSFTVKPADYSDAKVGKTHIVAFVTNDDKTIYYNAQEVTLGCKQTWE